MLRSIVLFFVLLMNLSQGEVPKVVVTIKPIHSLVAQLMMGIGEPQLLINRESPHGYALSPSNVQALNQADLVVWVGPSLEMFLVKLMGDPKFHEKNLVLQDQKDMTILPYGPEEAHDGHGHGDIDPHLWLSPKNAQVIAKVVAARLITLDQTHRVRYEENLEAVLVSLGHLDARIEESLKDVKEREFMVFHNAYQYFATHFGVAHPYVLTQNPEIPLSAHRVKEMKKIIDDKEIEWIYSEPQFPKAHFFAQLGPQIHLGELDPLGYDVPSGPEAYGIIMRNLADALAQGTT